MEKLPISLSSQNIDLIPITIILDTNNIPIILDKEKQYYRRLISEMINIKTQNNTIN